MVAVLVRYFGLQQMEIAEDIVQDTLIEAMEKWCIRPLPENPEAWLMDVAKKKTINLLKRDQLFRNKILPNLESTSFRDPGFHDTVEQDSTLRMIFTCCHPSLPNPSQVTLALKTLCGLSVSEIARALLTHKSTIDKRLYRARQKFRDGSIAYTIPESAELEDRLDNVYTILYILFSEGYYSSGHEELIRMDLCYEAIRLLEQLIASFPHSNKGKALLSLMFLSVVRFESRLDKNGALVLLSEQDRKHWNQELIAKGIHYLHTSINPHEVNRFVLEAGIAAEHCIAENFESTNWKSIYDQYTLLEKLDDNIIIRFNKCIAEFYAHDKHHALSRLIRMNNDPFLRKNVHYYTTIGVFYSELNQKKTAIPYFKKALNLSRSGKEKAQIQKRIQG